jgi:hypothetical protein
MALVSVERKGAVALVADAAQFKRLTRAASDRPFSKGPADAGRSFGEIPRSLSARPWLAGACPAAEPQKP